MSMRVTFISYEHTCVGFPHLKLKWSEEGTTWNLPYVTKHGIIINKWLFSQRQQSHALNREHECALFDEWVRKNYAEDTSVQG